MYSEKTYKNYIFWIQVKRVVMIILLTSLGAAIGVLIGKILESALQMTSFNNIIIIISSVIFFLLGLLFTAGTGKQVQDGYWRIAVLRKLTVIQKNIEMNNELLRSATGTAPEKASYESPRRSVVDEEIKDEETDFDSSCYRFDDALPVPKKQKKGFKKKLKKPEELN